MKNISKISSCLLVVVIIASCTVTKVTNRTYGRSSTPVVQKTLIADIKVDLNKKITGNATVRNGNEKNARSLAIWNAIETAGVHAIVHPVFKTIKSGITGKVISCSVIGYAGSYNEISTASNEDLLNYIRVRLLSGTGILGISFGQFSGFYYSLVKGEKEEDTLTEEELQVYYDEQVKLAKKLNKKKF